MSNISASFLTELACKIKAGNSLLSQILNAITSTSMVDGAKCDDTTSPVIVSKTVQTVPHPEFVQKVQVCPSPQKDPEVVCISNDGGVTVVSGWEIFDISESGIVTSTLFLNGVDVTSTYQVVPCGAKSKFDYEIEKVCVDGKTWTKTYVYDPTSTTPTLVSVLWLDEADSPVATPDITLINNSNCKVVSTPTISSAYGDDLTSLLPGNTFEISRTACCKDNVIVVTSIGSFTFPSFKSSISLADTQVSFTIDDIITPCDKSNIFIISQKTI